MFLEEGEPPPDEERQGGSEVRDIDAVNTQAFLLFAPVGIALQGSRGNIGVAVGLRRVASLPIAGVLVGVAVPTPGGGSLDDQPGDFAVQSLNSLGGSPSKPGNCWGGGLATSATTRRGRAALGGGRRTVTQVVQRGTMPVALADSASARAGAIFRRRAPGLAKALGRRSRSGGDEAESTGARELGVGAPTAPEKAFPQAPRLRQEEGREGGGGLGTLEGEKSVTKLRQLS